MRETYTGLIKSLHNNEIFVFGSNTQGLHGAGAAKWAEINAGAIYGQAMGLQGQSYAIVTKDLTKSKHPSVSKKDIVAQIRVLYILAKYMPKYQFMIGYAGKGPLLSGYTNEEMAQMFSLNGAIRPDNIIFEHDFYELVLKSKQTKFK